MPALTGTPRRTAAEILARWPNATVVTEACPPNTLFAVLKEWEESLPGEPPAPEEEDLADESFDLAEWEAYQYNECRVPLHLATDECMPVEIAERFGIPDDNWGPSYWPAEFLFPADKRQEIEDALRELGFTVVHGRLVGDGAFLDRWLY